jgi:hypothetical protein
MSTSFPNDEAVAALMKEIAVKTIMTDALRAVDPFASLPLSEKAVKTSFELLQGSVVGRRDTG